ncbi:MAG: HNH endonuclease [Lachnospiraceae bacterium]|nr:HNH endonuclease [Lachnospiraceae bacterium]
MGKRKKSLNFTKKEREKILQRDDGCCLFCQENYYMNSTTELGYEIKDIMHYIPKSSGGLGIEENGVLGCRYHHSLLDNGNKGLRGEMLERMKAYLKSIYPDWSEDNLIYKKYS